MSKSKKFILAAAIFFIPGALCAEQDFLKNIQLHDWKVNFGIEERLRYEYKANFDFNKAKNDNGSIIYNRFKLNTQALLKDKYEIFLEGLDGRVGVYQIKKPAQIDEFDLHQAYLKANNLLGLPIDLKMGRQEINYGKGRLLAAPLWSNLMRSFDMAIMHYKAKEFWLDIFTGSVVEYDDHNFNEAKYNELISGIYLSHQKNKNLPLIEAYLISLIDNHAVILGKDGGWGHLKRHTAGMRFYATLFNDFILDIETPYQFGKYGTSDINAYALHMDISHKFNCYLKPEVMLEFNLASGDKDPTTNNNSRTFVPLYQSAHTPYGIMDFFRWQNMRELAIKPVLSVSNKFKIIPEVHLFWLDKVKDSWYDSSGKKLRTDTSGQASRFVGTEVSLVACYDLNKNLKLESGYAHFFTGKYLKDTGSSNDADWLYTQILMKF